MNKTIINYLDHHLSRIGDNPDAFVALASPEGEQRFMAFAKVEEPDQAEARLVEFREFFREQASALGLPGGFSLYTMERNHKRDFFNSVRTNWNRGVGPMNIGNFVPFEQSEIGRQLREIVIAVPGLTVPDIAAQAKLDLITVAHALTKLTALGHVRQGLDMQSGEARYFPLKGNMMPTLDTASLSEGEQRRPFEVDLANLRDLELAAISKELKAGQVIMARWDQDGKFYKAHIKSVGKNGKISITWDDGGERIKITTDDIKGYNTVPRVKKVDPSRDPLKMAEKFKLEDGKDTERTGVSKRRSVKVVSRDDDLTDAEWEEFKLTLERKGLEREELDDELQTKRLGGGNTQYYRIGKGPWIPLATWVPSRRAHASAVLVRDTSELLTPEGVSREFDRLGLEFRVGGFVKDRAAELMRDILRDSPRNFDGFLSTCKLNDVEFMLTRPTAENMGKVPARVVFDQLVPNLPIMPEGAMS